MLMFVIQHQPHRAGTDLRRELVACLLAHGSTFSRVGASGEPGAVHTNYQNGIDWHLEWGASQFLTKTLQVGAVGYFYRQLTPDRGCSPILCPFESRTVGVGPQLGIIIPGASTDTYLNFKAYWDVDTQNRASGWSAWVTLAFSPSQQQSEKAAP